MARTIRDPKLDTPTARGKLPQSGKPYFRSIDTGLDLGYRRNQSGGKWVTRIYLGGERYATETIAQADDIQDADGKMILNWSQAQARARAIDAARRAPAIEAGPLTVGEAMDAYLARLKEEKSKGLSDTASRIEKHIRPALGSRLVNDLKRDDIAKWRNALADRARHVRGKAGEASRELSAPATDDERRRRQASANRTLTALKASLNQAFRDRDDITSDVAWRAVKPFKGTDVARVRYFTTDEVQRLVNASEGDFRTLVNAALFTGCRYGELCAIRVRDFNPDAGTLFVAQSKSGKSRHVVLTAEGQRFFEQITAGRASDILILTKNNAAWGPSHQLRPMCEVLKAARIKSGSFHILRHTAASHNVMMGVPLQVVAHNLGHADTRMTEKHYSHLAPSYVAEQLRKFAPTFGTAEPGNISVMKRPS